jgi:hypothetical protein
MREFILRWVLPWWGLRVVGRNYTELDVQFDAHREDLVRTGFGIAQKWRAAEKGLAQAKARIVFLEKVIADSHEVKRAKRAEKK